MGDKVFLNADRSAVVEQFGPGKKWQVEREEAVRLGLLSEDDAKPQARRTENVDATETAPKKRTTRKRK